MATTRASIVRPTPAVSISSPHAFNKMESNCCSSASEVLRQLIRNDHRTMAASSASNVASQPALLAWGVLPLNLVFLIVDPAGPHIEGSGQSLLVLAMRQFPSLTFVEPMLNWGHPDIKDVSQPVFRGVSYRCLSFIIQHDGVIETSRYMRSLATPPYSAPLT